MNTENNAANTKTTVFNLIILDESGSMGSLTNATISGCNETLSVIITLQVVSALQLTPAEAVKSIIADNHSRVFVFDDWGSTQRSSNSELS